MKMPKLRRALLAAGSGLIMLAGCSESAVGETSFTDEQARDIEKIVHEYLMDNPEILREMLVALDQRNEAKARAEALQAIEDNAEAIFNPGDGFVAGNPDGDVTIVEFFDYMCPFCRTSLPDLLTLMENDPNVRVVFIDFPVLANRSPVSLVAAKASVAAANQGKYLEFHSALMGKEDGLDENDIFAIAEEVGLDMNQLILEMNADDTLAMIEANMDLASKLNISGTPSFIVGKEIVEGAVGLQSLTQAVARQRALLED